MVLPATLRLGLYHLKASGFPLSGPSYLMGFLTSGK